ncbi:MAG: class I SAM-dependent methyltransferase [Acidobacteria bacterium]|nr:class I SAM-dependent methyltransferase [Acidobacteriota bacterium]
MSRDDYGETGLMKEIKGNSLEEVAREIFGPEGSAVRQWVAYWRESRERNRRILSDFARLVLMDFAGKKVLDIGCGTGGLGEIVADDCRCYVGADYHAHVLRFATQGKNRHYLRCSGISLPFADGTFDFIFAFDVIEHLVGGQSWQGRFLAEMKRVLRPLGMIFLTTPNFWYPYEGHTRLYFPHYLPPVFRDRYIGWRNPGFIREHQTFGNIKLLTPRAFRSVLEQSGLASLHELPCGLDKEEYRRQHPGWGWLVPADLGWYPHAEFWMILVHPKNRARLRLKLRKEWFYEQNQPSAGPVRDFSARIDFDCGPYGHQLGSGWHWHERDRRGYRWTKKAATCYLETQTPAGQLQVEGFSPVDNHLQVQVDGLPVAERPVEAGQYIHIICELPAVEDHPRILEVELRCSSVFTPDNPADRRELGVMIFSVQVR